MLIALSRKLALALFALLAGSIVLPAQPDTLQGLIVHPVFHGTLVLETSSGTIFVDPYGGAERFEAFGQPSLVLITHPHGDHLNAETLRGLDLTASTLIAPSAVLEKLPEDIAFAKVVALSNGEEAAIGGVGVRAVPMYNLPEEGARHPKGWGNGYILESGGQRVYISGDTEDIPEMRQLEDIDIAFVCMNLPYTMDVHQAADGVSAFRPAVVYPYHYRQGDGSFSDVELFRQMVGEKAPQVEVRLRDWYPNMD
ncbi:MBL fold metallo-hydrolase [Phaeodactylibacter luteus]|uniref:MBL fold metallo-hydrolase n=1 Tax=Phaeodactylibacter luteus TaxID=1564516 RepID=A0A5C6RI14_9BACT|nr:MBL fold metallo-hydrolase [Phaeodactylibacter luteus]TXB59423.1 MBL fold metallo-hydrolase [Phaeodactylibacter luteus]